MRNSKIERYVNELLTGIKIPIGDDILLEASNRDIIGNSLIIFYIHMIKYYYQPSARSTSWIASILNSREEIYNMYIKNKAHNRSGYRSICLSFAEDDFREFFNKAKPKASEETKVNIEYLDEYPFHNRETDFFNFDNICNANYLYYFLLGLALDNKDKNIVRSEFKKRGLL